MSKYKLQQRAYEASAVTYEQSQRVFHLTEPSAYQVLGEVDGIRHLSELFYGRVFADTNTPWFLNLFASSTQHEAIENQYKFLVQILGGPDLYRQAGKGKYTRLVGRHANYAITHEAARRWMHHMTAALQEHPNLLQQSSDSIRQKVTQALTDYFTYTAHYIVVASEYMRPDQLSGGTVMDPGRIW